MSKAPLLALALSAACVSPTLANLRAQGAEVRYLVDLTRAETQHVDVSVTFPTGGAEALDVMLPIWRPGRYAVLNPAATVTHVRARAGDLELPIVKTSKSAWRVETGGANEVSISYSVYANSLRDRTRHVDPTHAFLSGSSVFFYSPTLRDFPVRVEVVAPDDWDVATGLEQAPGEGLVLVAPNYDVLVDSPLEIGEHDRIAFEVDERNFEIVIWPSGVEHDAERMIEDFSKIIREHVAVFGRYPFERYVFLIHAGSGGGGTEHLNSTIMQTSRSSIEGSSENSSSYKRFLGLVSHEFFHTWNVKQLRPVGIHPYDYQNENYTDLLWLVEGGTSYYGALTLVRAELSPLDRYIERIGSGVDRLRRNPGARVQSVAAASWDAWIAGDNTDARNTTVDFYDKGSQVSMCLDLEIRKRSADAESLDSVVRTLFERFPLSGTGYSTEDLLDVLEEKTGSSFSAFFDAYVSGTERLPFEDVLPVVGLELVFEPKKPKKVEEGEDSGDEEIAEPEADGPPPLEAYLGLLLSGGGSGSIVRGLVSDGPAYGSGLLLGDEIIALDGERLLPSNLDEMLEDREPGDTVELHYLRDDRLRTVEIVLLGVPAGTWKVRRIESPPDEAKAAFASWTGHPWGGEDAEEEAEEEEGEGEGEGEE